VKGQKNDYNDAEAVAEAVQRRTVQLLKHIFEAQPLDLLSKRDCPIGAQSNEVKYLLAVSTPTTASDAVVISVFGFIGASPVHRP
jgi:hypothetical protein